MAMTITPDHDTEFEPSGRRRKITKFALAGVAVLGVGAALTSAAWSDNVFFGGDASTSDLDLQGRASLADPWQQGDNNGAAEIAIPALVNVGPGQTDTHTVYVLNSGTVDVWLNDIDAAGTGDLFEGLKPAGQPTAVPADDVLSPGESTAIVVSVTGNSTWVDDEYTDTTGAITVVVSGTSDSPPAP